MGFAFLELLILIVILLLVVMFITQVIIPMYIGTPLFPQFRPSTPLKEQVAAAEKELYESTEYMHLKESLEEINRRKAELEKK